jgi:hypothetical protein
LAARRRRLDKQTFYRDVDATYEGIKPIDLVPNLSPKNLDKGMAKLLKNYPPKVK